jgi:hypothetical protein
MSYESATLDKRHDMNKSQIQHEIPNTEATKPSESATNLYLAQENDSKPSENMNDNFTPKLKLTTESESRNELLQQND